jgi:hypothetical protein
LSEAAPLPRARSYARFHPLTNPCKEGAGIESEKERRLGQKGAK